MVTEKKALSLRDIVQYEEQILPFRHFHLKRKPKIAIVGLPGSGKSVSLGIINLNIFMIHLETCWSNLPTKYTYNISDNIAHQYGLPSGGDVTFESKLLDKYKLIRLSGDYHDGVTSLDEINIEYADAMKANTNVNFYLDQAEQQYRKDRLGLTCTTIDEMWIDPRLRSLIDFFIICKDLAYTPEALAAKKGEEGAWVRWTIYPMTDYFNGIPWGKSKTIYTCTLYAKQFWGIVDSTYKQATGKKYAENIFSGDKVKAGATNKMIAEEYSQWGALYKAMADLRDMGMARCSSDDMWRYTEQFYPDIDHAQIGKQLASMGIKRQWGAKGGDFILDTFKLEEPTNEKRLVLAGEL